LSTRQVLSTVCTKYGTHERELYHLSKRLA
jgi:hypothetical protein